MTKWLKPRRVHLLDEYRGLCILSMVAYHAAYDLVFLFGVELPGYRSFWMPYYQPLLAGSFIVLAGIACHYSRSNIKRGLQTFAMGCLCSLATWLFLPQEMIWYGILHFLGTSMLLYPLLRPLLNRLSVFAGLTIATALFVFTRWLPAGYLWIPGVAKIPLPQWLYATHWLLPLGFGGMGSDYFPLLPWLFLFLAGTFLGRLFYEDNMPEFFYRSYIPVLGKIGQNTMVIYLLHQPVIYGLLTLGFWLAGRAS